MAIEVVLPIEVGGGDTADALAAAPAWGPLLRLGLVDNGKAKSSNILQCVADVLVERGLAGSATMIRKDSPGDVITEEERVELGEVDAAITGVGDCGACSSCTVIDAVVLDQAGVPAVPIVTTPFEVAAGQTVRNLGHEKYPYIVLEHPIYTRPDEWFRAVAEQFADEVIEHIGGSWRRQPVGA